MREFGDQNIGKCYQFPLMEVINKLGSSFAFALCYCRSIMAREVYLVA